MTIKKEETFRFGPYDVARHADGTETWDDGCGWLIKIDPKEDKTSEPTLETQRDEGATI
jgi:hypothetical protein